MVRGNRKVREKAVNVGGKRPRDLGREVDLLAQRLDAFHERLVSMEVELFQLHRTVHGRNGQSRPSTARTP